MRKRLWWALGFASGGWGIALAARLCAPFSRHLTGLLRLYVLPAMGRAFARAPLPVGELAAILLLKMWRVICDNFACQKSFLTSWWTGE